MQSRVIGAYASEDHVRNPKLVSVFGSMLSHFCDNSLNFLFKSQRATWCGREKQSRGVLLFFVQCSWSLQSQINGCNNNTTIVPSPVSISSKNRIRAPQAYNLFQFPTVQHQAPGFYSYSHKQKRFYPPAISACSLSLNDGDRPRGDFFLALD